MKDAQNILCPISTSFREAADVVKLSIAKGRKVIDEVAGFICKEPSLINLRDQVDGSIIDLIKILEENERWNIRGLMHIFKANADYIAGKLKSGMHTRRGYDHVFKMCRLDKAKVIEKALHNGVTGLHIPEEYFKNMKYYKKAFIELVAGDRSSRIYGIKTLWPDSYDARAVLESARNIINGTRSIQKVGKHSIVFNGIDRNGIKATVRINKGTSKIITCFPDWFQ